MQEIYPVSGYCRVLYWPDVIQTAHEESSSGAGHLWAWKPVVSFKGLLTRGGRNYYFQLKIEHHCGKWGGMSSGKGLGCISFPKTSSLTSEITPLQKKWGVCHSSSFQTICMIKHPLKYLKTEFIDGSGQGLFVVVFVFSLPLFSEKYCFCEIVRLQNFPLEVG